MIRVNGHGHWLYASVDPKSNQTLHVRLFQTRTTQRTLLFLANSVTNGQSSKRCFSSITLTTSRTCSIDFGFDFKCVAMVIGTLSNVSFLR